MIVIVTDDAIRANPEVIERLLIPDGNKPIDLHVMGSSSAMFKTIEELYYWSSQFFTKSVVSMVHLLEDNAGDYYDVVVQEVKDLISWDEVSLFVSTAPGLAHMVNVQCGVPTAVLSKM